MNIIKDKFTAWCGTMISKVEERISHLMVKLKFQQTKPILQDKEVLDCLNDLYRKFVVVQCLLDFQQCCHDLWKTLYPKVLL